MKAKGSPLGKCSDDEGEGDASGDPFLVVKVSCMSCVCLCVCVYVCVFRVLCESIFKLTCCMIPQGLDCREQLELVSHCFSVSQG